MATSLETRTYDILQEASLLNQNNLNKSFRNSSQKGNTPVSKQCTPKLNSAAHTKKVAVSSFITPPEEETEDLMPDKANWDASAIEPLRKLVLNPSEKESTPGKYLENGDNIKHVKLTKIFGIF